jgi:hypothetical protein
MLALVLGAALALPAGAAGAQRETPIVVRVDGGGFRWADAAVGAVAGIGATLVTAGGVALVRLRRPAPDNDERGARP